MIKKSSLLGGRTVTQLVTGFQLKRLAATRKSRENQLKALRISVSDATPVFLFLPHLTFVLFPVFFAFGWSSTTSENLSEAEIIDTVSFPDKVLHETGLLQAILENNEILFCFDWLFFLHCLLKVGGRFLSRRVQKFETRMDETNRTCGKIYIYIWNNIP